MSPTGNNVRAFFIEVQDIEDRLIAAGSPVTEKQRSLLISRGFKNNKPWYDRMLALKEHARLNSIRFTYAYAKRELIEQAKNILDDSDDDTAEVTKKVDAIALSTQTQLSSQTQSANQSPSPQATSTSHNASAAYDDWRYCGT